MERQKVLDISNEKIKTYKDSTEDEQKEIIRNTKRWFRDTYKPSFNFDAIYNEEKDEIEIVYLHDKKKENYLI